MPGQYRSASCGVPHRQSFERGLLGSKANSERLSVPPAILSFRLFSVFRGCSFHFEYISKRLTASNSWWNEVRR